MSVWRKGAIRHWIVSLVGTNSLVALRNISWRRGTCWARRVFTGCWREHARSLMLFGTTVPPASPEVFICLSAYLLFPRLAAIMLVEQRSCSSNFKEDHLARVAPLEIDCSAHEWVVENGKVAQAAVLV